MRFDWSGRATRSNRGGFGTPALRECGSVNREGGWVHILANLANDWQVDSEPVRRGRGRPRLPQVRLTAPETVAITPEQYRQAVDLLASMILDYHYAQHRPAVQPGEQPPTPG